MFSFAFPKMLNHTTANLVQDKEAIRSNILLLFSSECKTLFGDPFFGCKLKQYIYEQSTSIVPDLLIDHLYTTVITFMPQVLIRRKDIKVYVSNKTLYADVKYTYVLDNTADLFTIRLTESTEEV